MRSHVEYFGFAQGEAPEELAREARAAIGDRRLRVDPNEAWDPLTASRMIRRLAAFDIEFVEQPTSSESVSALAQVKAANPVAVAADQLVFTPADAFEVCRQGAADVIVLGLHETGITTCAVNQAAATVPNLDDGNQYMNHFLARDIVARPDLTLRAGRLAVVAGPGLGFELDEDAVASAAEAHRRVAAT